MLCPEPLSLLTHQLDVIHVLAILAVLALVGNINDYGGVEQLCSRRWVVVFLAHQDLDGSQSWPSPLELRKPIPHMAENSPQVHE
jgi:hypothetical protein